jgi:hypothetical protein
MIVKKTIRNPYGLTKKQELVIADAIQSVANGGKLNLTASTEKIYNTKNKNGSAVVAYQNYNKINFREALIAGLDNKGILGQNGKLNQRLAEGLDATTETGSIDYNNRLKYTQEINKILGTYAPEKKQTSKLNINLDLSPKEMEQRIKTLQSELS